MTKIAIICPSKGRPDKLKRMWKSAQATAYNPDDICLFTGINGEEMEMYQPSFSPGTIIYTVQDWGIVYTINKIALDILNNHPPSLLMVTGDDTIFATPGWDQALLEHYDKLENKLHVYCLQDSRDANGTPHPIVTREYIHHMGYFFPPIFLHWYVDSWTSDLARSAGIFTHLTDYLLIHDKPSDRGQPDETHNSVRRRGWYERDSFVANAMQDWLKNEKLRLLDGTRIFA